MEIIGPHENSHALVLYACTECEEQKKLIICNYYSFQSGDPKYHAAFWSTVSNKPESLRDINCVLDETALPNVSFTQIKTALTQNSLFRRITTVTQAHGLRYNIMVKDQNDMVARIPENGELPIYDGRNDFTIHSVDRFKLGLFLKLDNAFIGDAIITFFEARQHPTRRYILSNCVFMVFKNQWIPIIFVLISKPSFE